MTGPGTRSERKERTRQALLDGTLELLDDRSFSSVSLREVTRAVGIVPTAFYRHFDSMEHLGVNLVEMSAKALRQILRDARRNIDALDVHNSLTIIARQVRDHEREFRFISQERYGGAVEIRRAIAIELRLFGRELAADLGRSPAMRDWEYDDIEWVSDLIVQTILAIIDDLLRADHRNPAEERDIIQRGENQLKLIAVGISHWSKR
ncbi:TetR family transcriptional regulator [Hoyosella rhizosphaerae]|uniref:TetR family transcriptional regulator n=1 Tax=Hoyosella rhizosphaerae TaxID=1755582 RepID=UPI001E2C19B2|nr:TetR family transcriptional regulator [Hoyosella rhizosphaerae]